MQDSQYTDHDQMFTLADKFNASDMQVRWRRAALRGRVRSREP